MILGAGKDGGVNRQIPAVAKRCGPSWSPIEPMNAPANWRASSTAGRSITKKAMQQMEHADIIICSNRRAASRDPGPAQVRQVMQRRKGRSIVFHRYRDASGRSPGRASQSTMCMSIIWMICSRLSRRTPHGAPGEISQAEAIIQEKKPGIYPMAGRPPHRSQPWVQAWVQLPPPEKSIKPTPTAGLRSLILYDEITFGDPEKALWHRHRLIGCRNGCARRFPDIQIELILMTTSGDLQAQRSESAGQAGHKPEPLATGGLKAMFTKEIEEASPGEAD